MEKSMEISVGRYDSHLMTANVSREQLEHEARAKIFWGEDPEQVLHFLRLNRFSVEDAEAFVDSVFRERMAQVRTLGVRRILIGVPMMTVPVGAWVLLGFMYRSVVILAVLGVAGAFGLWGAWKVLEGVLMLIFPENEKIDLAEE
jgi:hypothetical protein